MAGITNGYCEDDNAVYVSVDNGETTVTVHLTVEQTDSLIEGLIGHSAKVKSEPRTN